MKRLIPGTVALLVLGSATPSRAAFCMEPRAPSVFLRKPIKPFCAQDRSCEEWEVSSYKSAVERYFRSLESYLEEVASYQKKAVEYANCMADLD